MINEEDIRIVLGSKRYASSVDTDIWIQTPLIGDRRNMVEGDRSISINLEEQFNEERTNSDVFRISGKIVNIINNNDFRYSVVKPLFESYGFGFMIPANISEKLMLIESKKFTKFILIVKKRKKSFFKY